MVKKRQTTLGDSLDQKIISLYSLGMSYNDITRHIGDLYGVELSLTLLTHITDKILPLITDWQSRPLDEIYSFVWMDAMKDVLGIYLSETEGANFWLSVLTDLLNRGVKDILIACIDNLKGFSQPIESIYPKAEVQLCVIHQICNSLIYCLQGSERFYERLEGGLQNQYKKLGTDQAFRTG